MSDHLKIIPGTQDHRNFILKTFAIEYSRIHHINKNIAAAKMGVLLDSWHTAVAEAEGVPGEILGFLVYRDRGMLGWLYVKQQYRRHGIARALLAHADCWPGSVDVAFFSPHAAALAKEHGHVLRWRPYAPDTELEAWLNVSKLIEEGARLESEGKFSSLMLVGSNEVEGG
jgi:GNAT superfamily N-acetyltransferase